MNPFSFSFTLSSCSSLPTSSAAKENPIRSISTWLTNDSSHQPPFFLCRIELLYGLMEGGIKQEAITFSSACTRLLTRDHTESHICRFERMHSQNWTHEETQETLYSCNHSHTEKTSHTVHADQPILRYTLQRSLQLNSVV